MKNYYLVTTPIHYLHALEARNEELFHAHEHHLILLTDYHKSISQLEKIVDKKQWNTISKPFQSYDRNTLNFFQKVKMILFRKDYFKTFTNNIEKEDRVFWGNINTHWFAHVTNRLKCNQFIALEDGMNTISILNTLDNNNFKFDYSSRMAKIERLVLRDPKLNPERILFYTVYPKLNTKQKCQLHKFDNLRSKIAKVNTEYSVYFVAQPLVFHKFIAIDDYHFLINELKGYYEKLGYQFYYIPHRSTTTDYMDAKWNIKTINYPIELLPYFENSIPSIFSSFYSSAIINLSLTLKDQNVKFEFHDISEYLVSHQCMRINEIMQQMETWNIPNLKITKFGKR